MKTYLINLDRSTDRLAFMAEQFQRLGIAFERVPAVDGGRFNAAEVEEFARQRPGAPATSWPPAAMGAFLSHARAWERIVSGGDSAAAIFEDDAHLAADVATLLASEDWIPPDADLIRLEGMGIMKLKRGRPIRKCPGRRLHRAMSGTWGAAGYVVTQAGARTLLAAPPEAQIPIDHFMFTPRNSTVAAGLNRYQIVPSVCIQDQLLEEGGLGLASITTPEKRMSLEKTRKHRWLSFLRPHNKITIEFSP